MRNWCRRSPIEAEARNEAGDELSRQAPKHECLHRERSARSNGEHPGEAQESRPPAARNLRAQAQTASQRKYKMNQKNGRHRQAQKDRDHLFGRINGLRDHGRQISRTTTLRP